MSEAERALEFFRTFYYKVWASDHISSDITYNILKATEAELGYGMDNLSEDLINQELSYLKEEA